MNNIKYHLEMEGTDGRLSFVFETEKEAIDCYKFLADKYNDQRVLSTSVEYLNSLEDVINISVCKAYYDHIPSNEMAYLSPHSYYQNVSKEMKLAAEEYQRINL